MSNGFQIDGVLLVTGGGSGIGREIAIAFAVEGAKGVHLCDTNAEALGEVAKALKEHATSSNFEVMTTVMNVTKPEECEKAVTDTVTKWNRLDVSKDPLYVYKESRNADLSASTCSRMVAT